MRIREKRRSLAVLAAVLLGTLPLPARAGATSSTTTLGWVVESVPKTGERDFLFDVSAVASQDVWAVGRSEIGERAEPLVLHWNGSTWNEVATPTPPGNGEGELRGVDAAAANDVWAVGQSNGNRTLTEHWDGESWTIVPSPSPDPGGDALVRVSAIAANDVWAVGNSPESPAQPLLLHWNGTTWANANAVDPNPAKDCVFTGVSGTPGDVWAVGWYYDANNRVRTLAEHWNGHTLKVSKTPNPRGIVAEFSAVLARSPKDVWATGDSNGVLIEHWDGADWTIVPGANTPDFSFAELDALDAATDGTLLAGGRGLAGSHQEALIERWTGSAWVLDAAANVPDADNRIAGIAALSSSDAWAVGSQVQTGYTALAEHYELASFSSKMTLSASPNPVVMLHPVTVDGTLGLSNGADAAGRELHLQRRNPDGTVTILPDTITDGEGEVSFTETLSTPGHYTYVATFDGDAQFDGTSSRIKVTVAKNPASLTVKASPASLPPGQTTTLSGTLSLSDGSSPGGRVIRLKDTPPGQPPVEVGTARTTGTGAFTFTTPALEAKGIHTFEARWKGDATHASTKASTAVIVLSGRIAFNSDAAGSEDIYTMNDDGTGRTRLTGPSPDDIDPVWSPDGTRIAFMSDMDAGWDIWIMNADGSDPERLTGNGFDASPAWSPDGTRIAFSSDRSGNDDIWVEDLSTRELTQVTVSIHEDERPNWSPDGNQIAFESSRTGNAEIWSRNLVSGGSTQWTNDSAWDSEPAWSPDGAHIAFSSNRAGQYDVWLVDLSTRTSTRFTDSAASDEEPAWSSDGNTILFSSNRTGTFQIFRENVDQSGLLQLTTGGADSGEPDWHEL